MTSLPTSASPSDIWPDCANTTKRAFTEISSSSSSSIAIPPEPQIELVDCCVCLSNPAIPPVLFDCGHEVCGPCVIVLEQYAGKRPREANFKCPMCKTIVKFYCVSVHGRAQALKFATPVEREECQQFMKTHMSQPIEVQIREEKRISTSRVDRVRAQAIIADVFTRLPRHLIPLWEHNGTEFTYRLESVFIFNRHTDRTEQSATFTSVRNRIARIMSVGNVTVRRGGASLIFTLPVTSVDRFELIQWP